MLPDTDIAILAARAAGEAAARLQHTVEEQTKSDDSPVSAADLAADAAATAVIREHRPDDRIVSEEVASSFDGPVERVWIIDPIDGTRPSWMGKMNGPCTLP